jgi:hypothetical protein
MDRQGRIWIGTNRGLSCYQEQFGRQEILSPLVQLLSVEESGEHRLLTDPQSLNYNANYLTFHFRAISFIDEHNISYRYQLDGFDKDWSSVLPVSVPQVRYTNVPPGKYRFRFEAQNVADVWSPIVSSAVIIVAPPWWQT